jgi:glycine/D-amino acid oxidase-like deaminating enzyme/nitrite reductase/ring-hydroxylating ferredoxin subunit
VDVSVSPAERIRAFTAPFIAQDETTTRLSVRPGKIFLERPHIRCLAKEDDVKTTPYWFDSSKRSKFRPLGRSLSVDVLVVGAGVTGIVAAHLLKKAGLRVALLERDRLALRDTGHTTAHLTCVTDTRLHELVKHFGRQHAKAAWDAGMAAIDEIEQIVQNQNIACEFSRVPGYLHAPVTDGQADERATLKKDAKLANDFGFNAAYLDRVPFINTPGVRFADQAKFHPLKFLFALAKEVHGGGSHLFENSAVKEFDSKKKRARVNGNWINYDRVILATNNPLLGESSLLAGMIFQTKLALYSSYVIGAVISRGTVPIASFWDTNDPYQYLRVDRHGQSDYAIFGGEDHKTGQARNTESCFRKIEKTLLKLVPQAKVDHRWSGQVIVTNDGLPYIGPNEEDQFIATGYCGNGFTFGVTAAGMARDWVTGTRNPWQDLFSPDRKKIRGGSWDYLMQDRFRSPDGKSLRAVKRGEGKILRLGRKKLAVYRDKQGRVKKMSAVCTHMGCLVRWNQAEATWDCPCHGSRFSAKGKVLAGPAETPLE